MKPGKRKKMKRKMRLNQILSKLPKEKRKKPKSLRDKLMSLLLRLRLTIRKLRQKQKPRNKLLRIKKLPMLRDSKMKSRKLLLKERKLPLIRALLEKINQLPMRLLLLKRLLLPRRSSHLVSKLQKTKRLPLPKPHWIRLCQLPRKLRIWPTKKKKLLWLLRLVINKKSKQRLMPLLNHMAIPLMRSGPPICHLNILHNRRQRPLLNINKKRKKSLNLKMRRKKKKLKRMVMMMKLTRMKILIPMMRKLKLDLKILQKKERPRKPQPRKPRLLRKLLRSNEN